MDTNKSEKNYPPHNEDIEHLLKMLQQLNTSDANAGVHTMEEASIYEQQKLYELLGDRLFDSFQPSEIKYLKRKIGFALYGPPHPLPKNVNRKENEGKSELQAVEVGYDETEIDQIELLVSCIQNNQSMQDYLLLATIFVIVYIEGLPLIPIPVFRIPKPNSMIDGSCEFLFIDSQCRVYNSWNNYLKENILPKCKYCYPADGVYKRDPRKENNEVHVEFEESPACNWTRDILSKLDTVNLAASLGLTAVGLAALAVPLTGPLSVAATYGGLATSVYGAGRSVGNLADRAKHGQCISFTDTAARNCWLSMGSAVVLASSSLTRRISRLAEEGRDISKTTCLASNALNVGSITISSLGIVNDLWSLYTKLKTEEVTCLDLFQFTSSVLFFANATMNIKTARSIIQESNTMNKLRNSLKNNQSSLDKTSASTSRGLHAVEGIVKLMKGVIHINKEDILFPAVVAGIKGQLAQISVAANITKSRQAEVDDQLLAYAVEIGNVNKNERQVIIDAYNDLKAGIMTNIEFKSIVEYVLTKNNIPFDTHSSANIQNICKSLEATAVDCDVIWRNSTLTNISLIDYNILDRLLSNLNFQEVFKIAIEVTNKLKYKTAADFFGFVEFACPYFFTILLELRKAHSTLKLFYKNGNSGCCEEKFDVSFYRRFEDLMKCTYNCSTNLQKFLQDYTNFKNSNFNMQTEDSELNGTNNGIIETGFNSGEIINIDLFNIASEIAISLGYIQIDRYFEFVKFGYDYLQKEMNEMEISYHKRPELAKDPLKNEEETAKSYEIVRERSAHFLSLIRKRYSSETNLDDLNHSYIRSKRKRKAS